MPVIRSQVDVKSEAFRQNTEVLRKQVDDLRELVARLQKGGGEAACARHVARGKLLPRDRIRELLDPGSPFLELSQLAAYGLYNDEVPCAGLITGIGRISGQECMVVANDATVKGGT